MGIIEYTIVAMQVSKHLVKWLFREKILIKLNQ